MRGSTGVAAPAGAEHATSATRRCFYLRTGREPIFASLHVPEGALSPTAVLLCPPFGWEEFCSYRSRRAWAADLAGAGHPAMRIDLPATGDSAGSPRDPGRLDSWTDAVAESAAWLATSSGCTRVAVIGIGLGGLAACRALAAGAPIDDLVLWAVPGRGRTFIRELQAFARLNATSVDPNESTADGADADSSPLPDGSLEAGGFLVSDETAAALGSFDFASVTLPERAGRRVLMLERDGIGVDSRIQEGFEAAGAEVRIAPGPGYTEMMAHPQEAQPPESVFSTVSEWLAEAGVDPPAAPAKWEGATAVDLDQGGERIREAPFSIEQPFGSQFGVLTTPGEDAPDAGLTAVLFNAGALRRIGPGRMWVEIARDWAARGVPTLRVDIEGIGDTDGDSTPYAETGALYDLDLVDQIPAILDELERLGLPSRFVLAGLCSGAFWSFHTALRDDRVAAAFLLNPRAMYYDERLDPARDARKMRDVVQASAWRRVLRGEVRAERMRAIVRAGIKAPIRARADAAASRDRGKKLDRALVKLRDDGKRILFVFGEEEPLHEELVGEGRFESLEEWPNLELVELPGRDHDFRPVRAQQRVHAVLQRAIEREIGSAR